MEKAAFLDKDGTLVDNSQYPDVIPSDILLDNVFEGLKNLQNKGYKLIIISNQPWIAKGRITKEEVDRIFFNIIEKMKNEGISILDYFYCPHQSSDNCECKKPKSGMFIEASEKHNLDLSESIIIGDMDADILAGKNLGMKTFLVLTGKGKESIDSLPDYIIENLNSIKEII